MANLNNPVNVLFVEDGNPVAVSAADPLPVSATVEAEIGDWAVATAAAPTLGEGDPAPGSVDLTGQMRVTDADVSAALTTLLTAIGSAGDSAGDPTVIGLLKQIEVNTQ
jgi:hypothetical protein